MLSGPAGRAKVDGDVYQQVEIERGYFRRTVELVAEVRADAATARYEDGMLRVELPLVAGVSRERAAHVESTGD